MRTPQKRQPPTKRFLKKVDKNGPRILSTRCWIWTGAKRSNYGLFWHEDKVVSAHIFYFKQTGGIIPDGFELDHLCRNPPCINPNHLEPVTSKINVRRGISPAAINAKKTHCKRGHKFTKNNTKISEKGRRCRICLVMLYKRHNRKKRKGSTHHG
jgi:hypothetical protein